MHSYFKKKYVVPVLASAFLYVGVSFKNDFFEVAKQIEIFTTLFKELNTNYVDEINPSDLMEKAIKSMLSSLDPYTVYFNEQDVLKFKINNTGEYTGIGALITQEDNLLIVREVYKDFPADKAGIKPGDKIISIFGISLAALKGDSSELLKGSKNTKIPIQFERQGKMINSELILDEVVIKSVPFYSMIDSKTGYIVIEHFSQKAAQETKSALENLKKQGATQIVLDLRSNPGGLLNEAIDICNLFVPKGEIIVTTKSKIEKHNSTYKTTNEAVDTQIPLVIIVNGRSASASEIVSGALQDLDRAVVIGSRSYGKGLVQKQLPLTYDTQLKVTVSKYYTPSGRCIQALDYAHKDKNGVAIRTEEKNYNAFKTRKGRIVYDGGGILPDVVLAEAEENIATAQLLKNDAIFNYVTKCYYKNPNLGTAIPVISDADYQDFKQFLKSDKYAFGTETTAALKNTLAVAKDEKIDVAIQAEYNQLLAAVQKSQQELLDKNQQQIKNLLVTELIKRYQYQEGYYQYAIQNNAVIKKGVSILNDQEGYRKIIKL